MVWVMLLYDNYSKIGFIIQGNPTCHPPSSVGTWAPSQYPKRRLSVRSRKVSKPRDLYLELSDRSEIWQALRQQCCRCACQISKLYDNLKYQSRGFETLRDLTKRRLFGYWDGAQYLLSGPFFRRWVCEQPQQHQGGATWWVTEIASLDWLAGRPAANSWVQDSGPKIQGPTLIWAMSLHDASWVASLCSKFTLMQILLSPELS